MSSTAEHTSSAAFELAHHYISGDGAQALSAFLEGFNQTNPRASLDVTQYDNIRLQTKSRILQNDPPDAWTDFPGENLRVYVDANTVADISDVWTGTDMERRHRDVAADIAQIDGTYYSVPVGIHRINDLYVHTDRAREMGIDPSAAATPRELATRLERVTDDTGEVPLLFPMADPFTVLQLWEVTVLGQYDHRTYQEVTGGNVSANREEIRDSLEIVATYGEVSSDDAIYRALTDANEQFVTGEVPLLPQGDWSGGVFVDTDDFEYGRDWDRIAFPGTEDMFVVEADAIIPSSKADPDALRTFIEYAGSTDAQERFARNKGALPARTDASTDTFSAFSQDQAKAFDRSREQPQTTAHGLTVSPAERIELISAMASFIGSWDVEETTQQVIETLS